MILNSLKRCVVLLGSLLLLSSCGYHLGGLKASNMQHLKTFSVRMFENNSLEVQAGILVTNAVTDMVQRDGTYQLASFGECDFRIEGTITDVTYTTLQVNTADTYVSTEIGLWVEVDYRVIETKTNKVLVNKSLKKQASFYNEVTNTQTARDNAISYAARKIAEEIALNISMQ